MQSVAFARGPTLADGSWPRAVTARVVSTVGFVGIFWDIPWPHRTTANGCRSVRVDKVGETGGAANAAARRGGAVGALVRTDAPFDGLHDIVERARAGKTALPSDVAHEALASSLGEAPTNDLQFGFLTDRERRVLDLIAAGMSTKAIAGELGI